MRFESVNYRARVWLNGKPIGTNTGAYLPFEIRRPPARSSAAASTGSSCASTSGAAATDFPPVGPQRRRRPDRRLVELRRHPARGLPRARSTGSTSARSRSAPSSPCATCDATRAHAASTVRNVTGRGAARLGHRRASATRSVNLGTESLGAQDVRDVLRSASRSGTRKLWSPGRPNLYDVTLHRARGRQEGRGLRRCDSGIRSIKVVRRPACASTASRSTSAASACTRTIRGGRLRDRQRPARAARQRSTQGARRDDHPHALPAAPVHAGARRPARACCLVRDPGLRGQDRSTSSERSCASSAVDELADEHRRQPEPPVDRSSGRSATSCPRGPGPVQGDYIAARGQAAKALDPTRPVGLAVAGYPSARLPARVRAARRHRHQRLLRLVPGPERRRSPTATRSRGYLDAVRACYPNKAIMVTEFGAEANRDGPVEEKGTYAVPAGLRQLPPRRLRDQAVAQRRDLLGARGVPRAPGLGRRQPAARRRRSTRRAIRGGVKKPASPTARQKPAWCRREAVVHADATQIGPRARASSRAARPAAPRRGTLLETTRSGRALRRVRYHPRPLTARAHLPRRPTLMADDTTLRRPARPRGLPRDAPPAPRRAASPASSTAATTSPSPSPSTRAILRHALAARRRGPRAHRSTAATSRPSSSRTPSATRSAARSMHVDLLRVDLERGDPRDGRRRAHRRRRGPRRRRRRRARAGDARGQRRGAAERHPRDDHARRLGDGDQRHAVPARRDHRARRA